MPSFRAPPGGYCQPSTASLNVAGQLLIDFVGDGSSPATTLLIEILIKVLIDELLQA